MTIMYCIIQKSRRKDCECFMKMMHKNTAPVSHAYNPSCSGGRDQEDHSSKLAWENSSQDPISKKPITKMGW
jgi:hypothetical protein